jgi:hypothetical protein
MLIWPAVGAVVSLIGALASWQRARGRTARRQTRVAL